MLIDFDEQEIMNKRKTEYIFDLVGIKDYKYNPNGKYYKCQYKDMSFSLPLQTLKLEGYEEYDYFSSKLKNYLEELIK